jgi:transaldolase
MYVEELIGPETVNTMPDATITAFKNHGKAARTVDSHLDEARATMEQLIAAGIDYDAVTRQLENEGIASFSKSFEELLAEIAKKAAKVQA